MEGHQLYTMFERELRAARMHNAEVFSAAGDYRALSPRAKAIWQRVAQQFIDSQPRPRRGLHISPTGRLLP